MSSLFSCRLKSLEVQRPEIPLSFDVILRIFGGFTFISGQVFCVFAALVYITAGMLDLSQRGIITEAAVLGIPAVLVCAKVFQMVVSAEHDPENQ